MTQCRRPMSHPRFWPAKRYVIRVIDRNGAVVDLVESILIADEPRPYRIDVDLVAQVVA
jgi:hypothetical protein